MQGLTANVMQNYFNINRTMLTRYAQQSLIVNPKTIGQNCSGLDSRIVLYHPIAAIELATAMDLMKEHIFDVPDTYYGRIEAYRGGFSTVVRESNLEFRDIFRTICKPYPLREYTIRPHKKARMIGQSMKILHKQNKEILKSKFDDNILLTEGYLYYTGQMYAHYFIKMFNKHWKTIQDKMITVNYDLQEESPEKDILPPPWLNAL